MSFYIYLVGALVILAAGVLVGMIWTERSYEKHSGFMVKYMGLTGKSKKLVDGYISAREVHDERTTYRERK